MDLEKLEQNIGSIISDIEESSFIYDLLIAYGHPKSAITRLKKGDYNQSKSPNEILWKKRLFFRSEPAKSESELLHLIDGLSNDAAIKKHHPRFIIVTNFKAFLAIDTKTVDSLDIPLAELPKHANFFLPWAGMEKSAITSENPADVKAAEKMGQLYDLLLQKNEIENGEFRHDLNVFLSRLLFCFFAEDTDIFEDDQFTKGVDSHTAEDGSDLAAYLERLFEALNAKDRADYPEYLQVFPYVNGGLFDGDYRLPLFSRKSRKILIDCGSLDWAAINPDIFGSMMQAVTLGEERSSIGMHYTSVVNIMKLIEPLFLNDLKEQLEKADGNEKKLEKLLDRLYHIRIFDPACGSGNFLIIAYKELCQIEIEIFQQLQELNPGKWRVARSGIQLNQFFGIEIDDFAVETARLSLWLAEHQMNLEFQQLFGESRPTLPLSSAGNVLCGNATRENWETICPHEEGFNNYVLGNPPYMGSKVQSKSHKEDMAIVFSELDNYKFLDYIACWFYLAASYIGVNTKVAFVTTSSINQGLQVEMLWPKVFEKNVEIFFSYQPFLWSNSAKGNAGVTCSIVGLRPLSKGPKYIFQKKGVREVRNINAYLVNSENVIVGKSLKPLNALPPCGKGNPPQEGGLLILSFEEKEELLRTESRASKFIRPLSGSNEFINDVRRWCIWIRDNEVDEACAIPFIKDRVEKVREFRLKGGITARGRANTPHRFYMNNEPKTSQVIMPVVSSERREYIPSGYLASNVVVVNSANVIFDAEPFVFAIINSRIHMVWVRCVTGRLKTDIRYSPALCYNTFPFPKISDRQKSDLTKLAFALLDEREKYSEMTMASLYDPEKMPSGLRAAHQEIDHAVEACYRSQPFKGDDERLAHLFHLYKKMVDSNLRN